MPTSLIRYDKDLPEIPGRLAHLPPTQHLQKKAGTVDEFEIVEARRPTRALLVTRLRKKVDAWRTDGYPGASATSLRLLNFWFDEDHLVEGKAFRFFFGQREAIETLIWLVEVEKNRDAKPLVDKFAEVPRPTGGQASLFGKQIEHRTLKGGIRQIQRWVPESEGLMYQDLPAEDLRRYAFKMATGSGKTVVMAMAAVWSWFHKRHEEKSPLASNFLVVAPNVIVYQRLERDFGSNRIFHRLPLIPTEWKSEWQLKVILREDSAEPDPSGSLFLTNIQQIYASREKGWTPENAVDAILGRKPAQDLAAHQRSLLERLKELKDLAVMNDEAHHVHDADLQWHKTLMGLHGAVPKGLGLWLDFSATPKDQNGTYFPWIICDYPLAQAVEDRIVKAPIIVHRVDKKDPERVTKDNVDEKYKDWLVAAVERWKAHGKVLKDLGPRPVLFIMVEKNVFADTIGQWLRDSYSFKEKEVLVIHTDSEGEVSKGDLEIARTAARDIDQPNSSVKVIVSVLMLREGWDVRNVTVVLGLRPFTAEARILPEQAVGRGLRPMEGISPDRTQVLEVLGTEAFEKFVRELETEGLGITTVGKPPAPPVNIAPVEEKKRFDIAIPLTRPVFTHNYKKLDGFDAVKLGPIYKQTELEEAYRIRLETEFGLTETRLGPIVVKPEKPLLANDLLSRITSKTILAAKLPGGFAQLFPIVRKYVVERAFGGKIDLESEKIREHVQAVLVQEGIAHYLARKLGELTAEKRMIEFERRDFRLSHVKPFTWRRNLPLKECRKTIFNLVATFNEFEKCFGEFLDDAPDILRFASLGTTEQDSGTQFRVDYLKPSGAIGFYYPDWVAVQKTKDGEVNWIIETKGRVWEGTDAKDAAIEDWCQKVSQQTKTSWRFKRVNQSYFDKSKAASFEELLAELVKETRRR